MALISFTEKQVKYARTVFNEKQVKGAKTEGILAEKYTKRGREVFKCEIDGYVLRIGRYKVSKTWAIKFAKWILKSFDYDYNSSR